MLQTEIVLANSIFLSWNNQFLMGFLFLLFLSTVLIIMHYHLMEFSSGIFHLTVSEVFHSFNICCHMPLVSEMLTEKGPLHSKTLYLNRKKKMKNHEKKNGKWTTNPEGTVYIKLKNTLKHLLFSLLTPTSRRYKEDTTFIIPPWIEKHVNDHYYPFLAPQNTAPNAYLKPGS